MGIALWSTLPLGASRCTNTDPLRQGAGVCLTPAEKPLDPMPHHPLAALVACPVADPLPRAAAFVGDKEAPRCTFLNAFVIAAGLLTFSHCRARQIKDFLGISPPTMCVLGRGEPGRWAELTGTVTMKTIFAAKKKVKNFFSLNPTQMMIFPGPLAALIPRIPLPHFLKSGVRSYPGLHEGL